MTVYLVDSKPCFSVSNGFKQIDEQTYYQMSENGEISRIEVLERD